MRAILFSATHMDAQETQARQRDTRDIVRGAIVNLTGAAIRSLRLILLFILGRLHGAEGIGLFLLAYATLDTLNKLVVMGLDQAVLTHASRRYAAEDTDGMYEIIGQALVMSVAAACLISTGLALLAPWLAQVFFKKPELGDAWRVLAWTLPFWACSAMLLSAARALRVMHYEVLTKATVEPLVILTFALGFYLLGGGLSSLWVAVLISAVLGSCTATYMFSRKFSLTRLWRSLRLSPGSWRLYRFAMQIGLVDLVSELLKACRYCFWSVAISLPICSAFMASPRNGPQPSKKSGRHLTRSLCRSLQPPIKSKIARACCINIAQVTRWILILNACMLGAIILAGESAHAPVRRRIRSRVHPW